MPTNGLRLFWVESDLVLYLNNTKHGMLSVSLSARKDRGLAVSAYWDEPYCVEKAKPGERSQVLETVEVKAENGLRRELSLPVRADQFAGGLYVGFVGSSEQSAEARLRGLLVEGRLRRVLGIQFDDLSQEVVAARVLPENPAGRSGLRAGDVILRINGDEPRSAEHALRICSNLTVGEEVALLISRDGAERTVTIGAEY